MQITLRIHAADLTGVIEAMVQECALSGLGVDGTSEYEIVSVTTDTASLTEFECEVDVEIERVEGKFVGKDEITEVLQDHVESTEVSVGLEIA